eukprot:scaffold127141_cov60-Phaeocystis_antarctica.AAC.1
MTGVPFRISSTHSRTRPLSQPARRGVSLICGAACGRRRAVRLSGAPCLQRISTWSPVLSVFRPGTPRMR